MARYHTDLEIARLIERYSKPVFIPVIVPPPEPKLTPEQILEEVRKISENAVNRIYARSV